MAKTSNSAKPARSRTRSKPPAEPAAASKAEDAAPEALIEDGDTTAPSGDKAEAPAFEPAAGGIEVWSGEAVSPASLPGESSPISAEDAAVWAAGEPVRPENEAAPASAQEEEIPVVVDVPHMESIIESLLFASDRALGLGDLKRVLGERDGKKVQAALDGLTERRRHSGIEVVAVAGAWHLRTNRENARWVARLLAGRPARLSRATMETLAIVAYRQPVTRPEIDDIRGVDCGPVLHTLLDRGLIRIIGKKEEVGRPLLYGTTAEFLRVFNLRDLAELPPLHEFHELSAESEARVADEHGVLPVDALAAAAPTVPASKSELPRLDFVPRGDLPPEDDDADPLLDELDRATKAAKQAVGSEDVATAEPAEDTEGKS